MSDQAAAQTLACLPWVEAIVRRLGRRLPAHLSRQDLVSAGVVGLIEAQRRFDAQRGHSFFSFAKARIQGAVLDELRRGDLMAREARRQAKQIETMTHLFLSEHHRLPSEAESAQQLGLGLLEYRQKLEKLTPVRLSSFDEPQLGGISVAHPGESALAQVERQQLTERLARAIEKLQDRQQQVLHLYYRQECTLKQIGTILRVSESRACQIMSSATLQLRVLLTAPPPSAARADRTRAARRPPVRPTASPMPSSLSGPTHG